METPKALRDAPRAVEKLEFLEGEAATARAVESDIEGDINASIFARDAAIAAARRTKTSAALDDAIALANEAHARRMDRHNRRRADNAPRNNDARTGARMRGELFFEDAGAFVDARLHVPTSTEMAKPATEVARLRAAIEKLLAERNRAERAPRTKTDLIAASCKAIEDIAARYEPRPRLSRKYDGERDHNRDPLNLETVVHDNDAVGFLVWAFRDELIRRTAGLFDGIDLSGALSDADRHAELGRLDRQLLALEQREEGIIVLARENGIFIPRRDDASLLAVLGIERVR